MNDKVVYETSHNLLYAIFPKYPELEPSNPVPPRDTWDKLPTAPPTKLPWWRS